MADEGTVRVRRRKLCRDQNLHLKIYVLCVADCSVVCVCAPTIATRCSAYSEFWFTWMEICWSFRCRQSAELVTIHSNLRATKVLKMPTDAQHIVQSLGSNCLNAGFSYKISKSEKWNELPTRVRRYSWRVWVLFTMSAVSGFAFRISDA